MSTVNRKIIAIIPDTDGKNIRTAKDKRMFVVAQLGAEKVDGVFHPEHRTAFFGDKELLESMTVGDKIAV